MKDVFSKQPPFHSESNFIQTRNEIKLIVSSSRTSNRISTLFSFEKFQSRQEIKTLSWSEQVTLSTTSSGSSVGSSTCMGQSSNSDWLDLQKSLFQVERSLSHSHSPPPPHFHVPSVPPSCSNLSLVRESEWERDCVLSSSLQRVLLSTQYCTPPVISASLSSSSPLWNRKQ